MGVENAMLNEEAAWMGETELGLLLREDQSDVTKTLAIGVYIACALGLKGFWS